MRRSYDIGKSWVIFLEHPAWSRLDWTLAFLMNSKLLDFDFAKTFIVHANNFIKHLPMPATRNPILRPWLFWLECALWYKFHIMSVKYNLPQLLNWLVFITVQGLSLGQPCSMCHKSSLSAATLLHHCYLQWNRPLLSFTAPRQTIKFSVRIRRWVWIRRDDL